MPKRLMLVFSDTAPPADWLILASRFCTPDDEICLRGLLTIPADKSLSEGAVPAQRFRSALAPLYDLFPQLQPDNSIRVDYQPLMRVIEELQAQPADLLLLEWNGPDALTGGLDTDTILEQTPCDVVLLAGQGWLDDQQVLLSLRGGPNINLGLQTASALAGQGGITLFHAQDKFSDPVDLTPLAEADPSIQRLVTAKQQIRSAILREVSDHQVVVLGATFYYTPDQHSKLGQLVKEIHHDSSISIALVRALHPQETAFPLPNVVLRNEDLSHKVDRWFAENTYQSHEFDDLAKLVELKEKQGLSISVGLPALNEEATIGKVISTLKHHLMEQVPLIDELVLIDSDSTDQTVSIAQQYDIPIYSHSQIAPDLGSYRGKGEALWKSLHVLNGDLVAWVDTDISNIHPRFIYGTLGPLLMRPDLQYVKGFYQRPVQHHEGKTMAYGGGRVTELVARPLINLFYPELSGFIQPLSGAYAGRRSALEQAPFFTGYGVEIGLLMDFHDLFGLEALAQTDLEQLFHQQQSLEGLSKMAFAILQVFIDRLEKRHHIHLLDKANRSIKLITLLDDHYALDINQVSDTERPPLASVLGAGF